MKYLLLLLTALMIACTGPTGPQGLQGPQGLPGDSGITGTNGTNGQPGPGDITIVRDTLTLDMYNAPAERFEIECAAVIDTQYVDLKIRYTDSSLWRADFEWEYMTGLVTIETRATGYVGWEYMITVIK